MNKKEVDRKIRQAIADKNYELAFDEIQKFISILGFQQISDTVSVLHGKLFYQKESSTDQTSDQATLASNG